MTHLPAGQRAVLRTIRRAKTATLALVMADHQMTMREAFLALDHAEKSGTLRRSGGARGEPFRWHMRGDDE